MKENEKKAFDFAADTTKQLITLSTAIIALTITFSKDILEGVPIHAKMSIFFAWIIFILSIIFGVLTLLALTGSLDPIKKEKNVLSSSVLEKKISKSEKFEHSNDKNEIKISINGWNVRIPSLIQISAFILAMSLTVLFGLKAMNVN